MADYQCEECGARYGSTAAAERCALADSDADRAAIFRMRRRQDA